MGALVADRVSVWFARPQRNGAPSLQALAEVSLAERVVRGIQRALGFVFRNPDAAVEYWAQQAPTVPKEVWSLTVKRLLITWSRNGSLAPAAVSNVQDLLLEHEIIKRKLRFDEFAWQTN